MICVPPSKTSSSKPSAHGYFTTDDATTSPPRSTCTLKPSATGSANSATFTETGSKTPQLCCNSQSHSAPPNLIPGLDHQIRLRYLHPARQPERRHSPPAGDGPDPPEVNREPAPSPARRCYWRRVGAALRSGPTTWRSASRKVRAVSGSLV